MMRTICTARLVAPSAFLVLALAACSDPTTNAGPPGGTGGKGTPAGSGGTASTGSGGAPGSGGNVPDPTGSGGASGGANGTGGASGSGGTAADAAPPRDASPQDFGPPTPGVVPNFPGTRGNYGNGHSRFSVPSNGRTITVYAPQKPRDGLPWVWHGEFPDQLPNTNNAWLAKGLMIVYVNGASEQYGSPDVIKIWDDAYHTLVDTYKMGRKMVITGISRGGLYAYNFANTHPDQVAGVYADNGTCDFRSWPGGRQLMDPRWVGPGGGGAWQTVLRSYHFASTAEAIAYKFNPVDNLEPLAKAGIKLLHVTAQMDSALPWKENTGLIETRYPPLAAAAGMGGTFTVIYKPNADHHPHGLEPDPSRVVDWTVATLVSANGLAP